MVGIVATGVFVTATAVMFGACVQIVGDNYADSGVTMPREASRAGAGPASRAESGSAAPAMDSSASEPQASEDTPTIQADLDASAPASPAADAMIADTMMSLPQVPAGALPDGARCGPPNELPCASGICDTFCCSVVCGPCQQCGESGQCESLGFGADEMCVGSHSCSAGLCAEIDQASTESTLDLTLSAGQMLAQTVTVAKTGKLVEVRLSQGCGRTLSLRGLDSRGVPAETALAESIQSTVHLDGSTESFEFDLDVHSNERLAIVLRNDQGSDCTVPVGTGNPYLGGELLSWNAANDSWSAVAANDMTFLLLLQH